MQVAAERAIGGELCDENPLIVSSNAIGVAADHKPDSANKVVQFESGAECIDLRFKDRHPRVCAGLLGLNRAFIVGGGGGAVDADCDVAVKFVGRIEWPSFRKDARCCHRANRRRLEEAARSEQGRRRSDVAVNRRQLILRAGHLDVESVGVEAGQVRVGEGADVRGHRVDVEGKSRGVQDLVSGCREEGERELRGVLGRDILHENEGQHGGHPTPFGEL